MTRMASMWPVGRVLILVAAGLMLAGCAAGPNAMIGTGAHPAGFWRGLWHGLIAPITFLVSLFTTKVGLYEVHNSGNWYDFGFMLGLVGSLGSGGWASTARTRPARRRSEV